jgi:hypothetical protein
MDLELWEMQRIEKSVVEESSAVDEARAKYDDDSLATLRDATLTPSEKSNARRTQQQLEDQGLPISIVWSSPLHLAEAKRFAEENAKSLAAKAKDRRSLEGAAQRLAKEVEDKGLAEQGVRRLAAEAEQARLAEEDANRLTEKEPEVKGTAEVEEATKVAEDDAKRMAVDIFPGFGSSGENAISEYTGDWSDLTCAAESSYTN